MAATTTQPVQDGIHALPPREKWTPEARKRRDLYAVVPGAPLLRGEFGYLCFEEWLKQGFPAEYASKPWAYEPFLCEGSGSHGLGGLGWCEGGYVPGFEVKILEDRGDTEVEQDWVGRKVLYFKGRRNGFMPEYIDHPVKDMKTWEEQIKWRLDPATASRFDARWEESMVRAREAAARGEMIVQHLAGSGMYLRAMMGVEAMLLNLYDQPKLIEACMERWFELADAVLARHQQHVTLDEVFFAEDICYNHGPLIGPAMMRSMLMPYYQQLLTNIKRRQLDPARHLYVQIDTDGDCRPLIAFYEETIGMDTMSPFEVASGCDVVEIGRRYPRLVMKGGIDKRVLAQGRKAIDAMLERIIPAMRARGGYYPMCDHCVPAEVPFQDYLHYRSRCVELGG
jgi:hypothetical protein